MKRLIYFFLFLFIISNHSLVAQILDDSTKLVYGAHTTKYVTQEDIFTNSGKSYNADTSISDFHNYDFLYNGKMTYQNLGNLGTPLSSIYPLMPRSIGKSFGFYGFDLYAFNPEKIKYYDTRSPFSSVHYVQGALGQQWINALITINPTHRWNTGFQINKFTSKKLIGRPLSNEKQADHTSFVFFTRFFTKDSIYQILANYSFMDHKNFETGGVVRDTAAVKNLYYDYKKQQSFLHAARSFELRQQFHLLQQLSPFKDPTLQVFHELDYKTQSNRFNDNLIIDSAGYYPNRIVLLPVYFNQEATFDRTDFNLLENKAGIKGSRGIAYYNAYYRNRLFNYRQFYPEYNKIYYYHENYLGADVKIDLPIKGNVYVLGEYLVSRDGFTQLTMAGGNKNDYQLKAEYRADYLNLGYHTMNVSPTLLSTRYIGNSFVWDNRANFSTTQINRIYGSGKLEAGKLVVSPELNFFTFQNYIYFDNLAMPTQHTGTISYFSADLFLKYSVSKFYLENLAKYAHSSSDVIQVPQLYNHARLYYQNKLFKHVLLQIGFDVFYRKAYYANAYMPVTQQFYLNQGPDAFLLPDYFNTDFFLNARIKSANIFVKLANFNQQFGPGNMITPYYPVTPLNFVFGIKWLFFD